MTSRGPRASNFTLPGRGVAVVRLTLPRLATVVACLLLAPAPAAQAQQKDKVARVGGLPTRGALTPDRNDALENGLSEFGYVGVIEERYADGKLERLPGLAAELATMQVDVILATDNPAAHAAKKFNPTIPVVFVGPGDPVGSGLVPNLARP